MKNLKIKISLLVIVTIGIVLRTIFFFLELNRIYSAGTYVQAAKMIFSGQYTSFREPTFPFFGFLLILIIGDPNLSLKLVSYISGILVIPISYFVFKKSSLKIFGDNNAGETKSEYVGLFVSLFYSINAAITVNSAHGLREELISLLFILIFYFTFVKDNDDNMLDKVIIFILFSAFTLIHLTLGIFTIISITLCYLIIKLKIVDLKFNISIYKLIIAIFSFIISITWWFIHCTLVHGDPFYTMNMISKYEQQYTDYEDSSLPLLINSIVYGFEKGIYSEFEIFIIQIGLLFIILTLFSLLRYRNKKIPFFLGFILAINLLYLSPFIAFWPRPRLLLYLYPFIFFLGFLMIVDIWYEDKDKKVLRINILKKEISISNNFVFIFFLIFLIFGQLFWNISQIFTLLNDDVASGIFYNLFNNCLLVQNILLGFLLIFKIYNEKIYIKNQT